MVFAGCLVLVTFTQLFTRYFFELPALHLQEHRNDVVLAEQTRHLLSLELARKATIAIDNGHWTGAYDFMKTRQEEDAYAEFLTQEFQYQYSVHTVPRVDGYRYFDLEGRVFFESVFDHQTLEPGEAPDFAVSQLLPLISGSFNAVASGFVDSSIGPIVFAITGISNDDASIPPIGHLMVWQRVNQGYFKELMGDRAMQFDRYDPALGTDSIAAILASDTGVTRRGNSGQIQWILRDVFGDPLFVVTQPTPARTFNAGAISLSDLVGFATTVALLVLFSTVVSRRIVTPLEQLSEFVGAIARSEDFSLRLPIHRGDEIGIVARYLDRLLGLVESQDQALRQQNRKLEDLADRDALTGTYNRRFFDRELERDWARARRDKKPLACIMLDIDWFGKFNNSYGHPAGDSALVRVATALCNEASRATDSVCRYGGEEFVVLLPGTSAEDATLVAERILTAVADLEIPHPESETADVITASAGVASMLPSGGESAAALISSADQALYRAKAQGRNQVSTDG